MRVFNVFRVSLLPLFLVGLTSMVAAQSRCDPPAPVTALLVTLDAMPLQTGPLPADTQRTIARHLARVQAIPATTLARLRAEDATAGPLDDLLEQAATLAASGQVSNTGRLDSTIKAMWKGLENTCSIQSVAVLGQFDGQPIRHSTSSVPFADGIGNAVPVIVQVQRMGAVMAGIIAFAFTALFLELCVKRVFLRVFHCRSCLIPAVLQIEDARFDGTVSLLSRDGACFRADEADRIAWYQSRPNWSKAELTISDIHIPAKRIGRADDALAFSFTARLRPAMHREILEGSLISTYQRGWPSEVPAPIAKDGGQSAVRAQEPPKPIATDANIGTALSG